MILKELVHVIIIVEQMSIAVLINIHAHATPKLQGILLVHVMFKLVLPIQQYVIITVHLIGIVLTGVQ